MKEYIQHLKYFENNFKIAKEEILNHEINNKLISKFIDNWTETNNLKKENIKLFILFYVKNYENILENRKKLSVFEKIKNQNGNDFIYKGNVFIFIYN